MEENVLNFTFKIKVLHLWYPWTFFKYDISLVLNVFIKKMNIEQWNVQMKLNNLDKMILSVISDNNIRLEIKLK